MVPEENSVGAVAPMPHATPHLPLLAISSIRKEQRFDIPTWAPREGRNEAYVQWKRQIGRLLQAFGLRWENISDSPPQSITPSMVTRQQLRDQDEIDAAAAQLVNEANWKRINTAIYWHVEPSLIMSGLFAKQDREEIDELVNGHLADGRGIIRWANSMASVDDVESQNKLLAKLLRMKLSQHASRTELQEHVETMHESWLLLAATDATQLVGFLGYLQNSLPTEPEGSHLSSLRIWFAGEVSSFKTGGSTAVPAFATYKLMLKALQDRRCASLGL